jgi:hypothetical protein
MVIEIGAVYMREAVVGMINHNPHNSPFCKGGQRGIKNYYKFAKVSDPLSL